MNTLPLHGILMAFLGKTLLPGMILLIALAFIIVIRVMASRYKKIPPNEVGIFYGRKYRYIDPDGKITRRGFRVVAGGGALLWPVIEHFQPMSTAVTQVEIDEHDIPNKDNVKISAKGVATFKIETTQEALHNAAAAFLGKSDEELARIVRNILQGHLRSIIGKLNINEILRDRDAFNKKVVEESTEELKRLGIQIITLVIQEVTDEYGYIDALGKQSVAEAIRDANIKTAQAEAETKKKVSDCNREADITVASNAIKVSEAERDRDVKKAQFKTIADAEKAKADQAFGIAMADQEKTLKVKQARARRRRARGADRGPDARGRPQGAGVGGDGHQARPGGAYPAGDRGGGRQAGGRDQRGGGTGSGDPQGRRREAGEGLRGRRPGRQDPRDHACRGRG